MINWPLIHSIYFSFGCMQDLSYKEKHWHEACFLCNKCRVSLVDKQFGSKAEKIYCGNCYDSQFASRCDGCSEVFRAGKCTSHHIHSILMLATIGSIAFIESIQMVVLRAASHHRIECKKKTCKNLFLDRVIYNFAI